MTAKNVGPGDIVATMVANSALLYCKNSILGISNSLLRTLENCKGLDCISGYSLFAEKKKLCPLLEIAKLAV